MKHFYNTILTLALFFSIPQVFGNYHRSLDLSVPGKAWIRPQQLAGEKALVKLDMSIANQITIYYDHALVSTSKCQFGIKLTGLSNPSLFFRVLHNGFSAWDIQISLNLKQESSWCEAETASIMVHRLDGQEHYPSWLFLQSPPTDSEVIQYFNLSNKPSHDLNPWVHCANASYRYHSIQFDENGYIRSDCVPDTLYAWGPKIKFDWWKENVGVKKWPGLMPRVLWTTSTPSSSWGYGTIPLRIKLKAGVKFKLMSAQQVGAFDYCNKVLKPEEVPNTIILRYLQGIIEDDRDLSVLDYIICSTDVIHSWSSYTKEHYDEIVADLEWIANKSTTPEYFKHVETYVKNRSVDTIFGFRIDNYTWERPILLNTLRYLRNEAEKGSEVIYYNTGVTQERESHFNTKTPIYFNPQ